MRLKIQLPTGPPLCLDFCRDANPLTSLKVVYRPTVHHDVMKYGYCSSSMHVYTSHLIYIVWSTHVGTVLIQPIYGVFWDCLFFCVPLITHIHTIM